MKKLILAAIAASVVAVPAAAEAAAPQHPQVVTTVKQRPNGTIVQRQIVRQTPQRAYRQQQLRYAQPRATYRNWQRGQRFDARYARNYRQIDYRQYRGTYAPPRGYRWVQSNNDAVLVSIASGLIGAVIGGALAN